MSASLVGSEMCIRDSLKRNRVRGGVLPREPATRRSAGRGSRPSGGPLAVSYTHLTLPTICSV
eukprot:11351498-Alexandrium_andersonii.AAC.1